MHSIKYKVIEFLIVFIIVPVSFAINYSPWVKLGISFSGFIYVMYVLLKIENLKFKISKHLNWKPFWKATGINFFWIAIITILFVHITDSPSLFSVLLNKPLKWLILLLIYCFFSVYPQELIFRTFFFKRYQELFKNESLLIFVNAIVFSLSHLFFRSTLVLVLTFVGGFLFAYTYKKTQSTILVSIEHAIYGCWLFTVGMGAIFGFPV